MHLRGLTPQTHTPVIPRRKTQPNGCRVLFASCIAIGFASTMFACNQNGNTAPEPSAAVQPQPSNQTHEAEKPMAKDQTAAQHSPTAAPEPALAAKTKLHSDLQRYIDSVLPELQSIPEDRKQALKKLALFVRTKLQSNEPANLTFICTHNSRRSHLGQLWAATAAAYYGVDRVQTFSGGTEATAFNPRAVAAIERAGFQVEKADGENPHYKVSFASDAPAQECFSKTYNDPFNPKDGFAAIMTCTEADKNCPTVAGASLRVPLPYIDPKVSDGSAAEATTYDERTKQIAVEMFYLFSQVDTR